MGQWLRVVTADTSFDHLFGGTSSGEKPQVSNPKASESERNKFTPGLASGL